MKRSELERMSVDDLWALHVEISGALAGGIAAEKSLLEKRLRLLSGQLHTQQSEISKRRPYPPVIPKFCNPDNPAETWAGRGRQPRWVTQQLRSGKRMEEFRIQSDAE